MTSCIFALQTTHRRFRDLFDSSRHYCHPRLEHTVGMKDGTFVRISGLANNRLFLVRTFDQVNDGRGILNPESGKTFRQRLDFIAAHDSR